MLFIFNPANKKVTYTKTLSDISGLRWRGGGLQLGRDENMYSTIGGSLFKVIPNTKKAVKLFEDGMMLLAEDDHGNFYFRSKNRIDLLQYKYDNP